MSRRGAPGKMVTQRASTVVCETSLLTMEEFDSVRHARAHSSAWREDYNGYRPHSSLGGLPPNTFAQRCADSAPFAARTPLHQHSDTTPVTQPVLS